MTTLAKMSGATALGLVLAAVAVAQTSSAPASSYPSRPSGAAAGNAVGLTLQQFEAKQARKLLARDTDGDGMISRAEFLAGAKAGKGDPAARFAKLDHNSDVFIDKGEIDARLARRFRRLDTDGNGVLTPAERAAARHKPSRSGVAGDGTIP